MGRPPLSTFSPRDGLLDADEPTLRQLATLGVLTASLAHEINNILTPMLNRARLAETDEQLRERAVMETIRAGERIAAINRDILRIAKPDRRAEDSPKTACVASVVSHAGACIDHAGGDVLEVDVPADIWASIDPGRLEQVLINLIRNASTAISRRSPERTDPPRIRISAACSTWNTPATPVPGACVRISVQDNGEGIRPAQAASIFEPFERRETAEGSGLGLFLSKALVEAVGGSISASSEYGTGTEFIVELPVAEPTQHREAA